jgi:serine/threonine transporter
MKRFIKKWTESSLIIKILIGVIIGVILGIYAPNWKFIAFPGDIFVNALKAIAPILVFVLVASAISKAKTGIGNKFKTVIIFYMFGTLLSAIIAVIASYLFPVTINLANVGVQKAPEDIGKVISDMILMIFSNPIQLLSQGHYLGILFWAIVFGIALKMIASDTTKDVLSDLADSITLIVRGIIQFAPIGIMGLVFSSVSKSGVGIFVQYGQLIMLLVGCVALITFVINPIIIAGALRRNPFPLVFTCLKESGITAFFSRSSAANIPVNMNLCDRLGLDRDFYSISIPLGAAINMEGAAITITVMTLTVCHTMGISVPLPIAAVLCIISTLAACGASGVAGGSLMLVPMACSMFGIGTDVAMQAVAVGFIIGVIQDSCETALNSSSDALFSATAEYYDRMKDGEPVNFLGEFAK